MKFYAVLNKKESLTNQVNAIAHTTLGLFKKYSMDSINFSEFYNSENQLVSNLTDSPFIILSAKNGNQLRSFHKELLSRNFPQSAFFTNMIDGGTIENQIDTIKQFPIEDLNYVAVITFGEGKDFENLTKRFSLFKNPL